MKYSKILGSLALTSTLLIAVSCDTNRGFKSNQNSIGGPTGPCVVPDSTVCTNFKTAESNKKELMALQKKMSESKAQQDQEVAEQMKQFLDSSDETNKSVAEFIAFLKQQDNFDADEFFKNYSEYSAVVNNESSLDSSNQEEVNVQLRRQAVTGQSLVATISIVDGKATVTDWMDEETRTTYVDSENTNVSCQNTSDKEGSTVACDILRVNQVIESEGNEVNQNVFYLAPAAEDSSEYVQVFQPQETSKASDSSEGSDLSVARNPYDIPVSEKANVESSGDGFEHPESKFTNDVTEEQFNTKSTNEVGEHPNKPSSDTIYEPVDNATITSEKIKNAISPKSLGANVESKLRKQIPSLSNKVERVLGPKELKPGSYENRIKSTFGLNERPVSDEISSNPYDTKKTQEPKRTNENPYEELYGPSN